MAQELKAETIVPQGSTITLQMYPKAEVDAVLAEKDAEIRRLKDSLGKLLKAKTEQIMDEVIQKTLIYGEGFVPVEHAMKLVAETRHHKYKRCLAMAKLAVKDDYAPWNMKWHKRWLELAEKFMDKEAI